MSGLDNDGDGLSNVFEDSIGTNKEKIDTDGDGYNDKDEILGGNNPIGQGKIGIDNNFAEQHKGKIFIQVESNGEAWYINPVDSKRYFLSKPKDAFNIMRGLGLGITNNDLVNISSGDVINVEEIDRGSSEISLSASPNSGSAPLEVTFTYTIPNICDGLVIDYGDKSQPLTAYPNPDCAPSSKTATIKHTYSNTGIYTAMVSSGDKSARVDVEVTKSADVENNQVWFGPNQASVDMLDLFNNPDQWESAREKVDVFQFYSTHVEPRDVVEPGANALLNFANIQAFSKLKDWGIDIAIETFFLSRVDDWEAEERTCISSEEAIRRQVEMVKRHIKGVQDNGGVVRYITMDSPFSKGYYKQHGEPFRPCQYDTIEEIANDVAKFITEIQSAYPSILIGDLDPYPAFSVDQLKEWILALEKTGVSLSFFHLDVSMGAVESAAAHGNRPNVTADLRELQTFFKDRNIAFGVIYGDGTYDNIKKGTNLDETGHPIYDPDYSDEDYYKNTIEFIDLVASAIGEPEHSIFQSWREAYGDKHKKIPYNLPENDPYSHTHLINEGLDILRSK